MDNVPDAKVYSAKHAIRAFKAGDMEYAVVLCCSKGHEVVVAAETDGPPELGELLRAFAPVFEEVSGLPPWRIVDHAIELEPGARLVARPPYCMAPIESAEVKAQIDRMLEQGLIETCVTPFAASSTNPANSECALITVG